MSSEVCKDMTTFWEESKSKEEKKPSVQKPGVEGGVAFPGEGRNEWSGEKPRKMGKRGPPHKGSCSSYPTKLQAGDLPHHSSLGEDC